MNKLFNLFAVIVCLFVAPRVDAASSLASDVPFKDLIAKKLADLKQGKVGDFRLAWGNPDARIEKHLGDASRNDSNLNMLGAIQNAQANQSKNSLADTGRACVIMLVVHGAGAYVSARECTMQYPDRAYMDTVAYPQTGMFVVGRLPNIDFVRNNSGNGYATFYTAAGYVSEFVLFVNSTQ